MQELEKLILQGGLYSKIKISNSVVSNLESNKMIRSLDLYCPKCKSDKTFVLYQNDYSNLLGTFGFPNKGGTSYTSAVRNFAYICPNCETKIFYSFYYDGEFLHKIAQYPSLMDVSRDELKQYEKSSQIDGNSFKEIYRAYECASSGFFVAAYTYMRRVFENLLLELFKSNQATLEISLDDFERLRFDEKLELLKDILAIEDAIYKPLYSILSKGIHSLPENECEEYFNLLKIILLDILAEQKAKEEKEKNRKAILDLYAKKKAEGKKDD